jgi:LmbE family N-acetylglucosaminyl deacetylase
MTAQTTKERQEALRARRAMLGLTEVRGLYLPPDLHADIKALARAMVEKLERARNKEPKP